MSFDLRDYVDVAERVQQFYAKFPNGSIQSEVIELTPERVVIRSFAYRNPEDQRPATGMSQMNIPGTTQFTRGSEVENTETSAVGRAIAMLGFATNGKIASRQEVMNKQHDSTAPSAPSVSPSTGGAAPAIDLAARRREINPGGEEEFVSGRVNKGRAPVDMSLRQTPDGWAFGFVIEEQIEGKQYPRKTQVLATGDLAHVMAATWDNPVEADVWGRLEMVPWEKDGQSMRPFRRIVATRVMTAEWTLPAAEGAAPVSVAPAASDGKVADLDDLPF